MENQIGAEYEVKTARTVFIIIEILQANDGLTLTETAERLDKSIGATHNHLKTLEKLGYVVNRDGEYHVGLQFLHHGMHALRQQRVARVASDPLEKLAEETAEFIWLVTEERGKAFALQKHLGERAVQTDGNVGRPLYMHCTANGKAILATLPESRVEEIVAEHGLPARTEHTITDVDELYDDLERTRERGYAINDEESVLGERAIACAVADDEETYGAVSVSGPTHRITDSRIEDELVGNLLGTVNEIVLRLNYDANEPQR